MQKIPIILLTTGVIILIVTVGMGWFVIPSVIKGEISKRVRLVNGTDTWERWANITTPIFMSYYIFNTTNPSEVIEGKKPILEEFGPFVYEEKRIKVDLELNDVNGSVYYRQPITYFFRPDMSNGTEDDVFTVINALLVGVKAKGDELSWFHKLGLSHFVNFFKDETIFLNLTVSQILFQGRYVPLMKSIESYTGETFLHNHTFGLFYPNNGSDDGIIEVKTGVEDSSEFGQVVSWKGKTQLEFWDEEACNKISGSDGSIYPPFVERDRVVGLFSVDLCRSLYLKYTADVEVKNIRGYKFALPKEIFEDPRSNPDNVCFCKDPGENLEKCLKSGVMTLKACKSGAPAVVSTPHFLDGSEEYVNQSIGLVPDRSRHLTYVVLEPNTGLILEAHKRIQINVDLSPDASYEEFVNVPEMIYPILWVDGYVSVSDEAASTLQDLALTPIRYVEIGKWSLIGFSFSFIVAALFLLLLIPSGNQYPTTKPSLRNKATNVIVNPITK